MAFELFDRKLTREQELTGTISPHGRLSLNTGATTKLGSTTSFVQVYWDKEARRCGLKASAAKTSSSFRAKANWNTLALGIASFLNHIGYDRTSASVWKFRLEWDEGQGMLVFAIPAERLSLTKEVRQPKPRAPRREPTPKASKGNGVDSTHVEHGGQSL